VAPSTCAKDTTLRIWLPAGQNWFYLWNDKVYKGGQEIAFLATGTELPVFVKAGAIIPKYEYALSTAWQKPERLIIDVYAGKSSTYTLYEDDGVTEKFRKGECRKTLVAYDDRKKRVRIKPDRGTYHGAPNSRSYKVCFHTASGIRYWQSKPVPFTGEVVVKLD
jgi:alpha-D-xyloside xylohydrolase